MRPHPDFAAVELPRAAEIGPYRLTPLSPEFVDEDFEAVMATAPLLGDIFGDWPNGLTRSENLIDLAWHEREFTARRSFSWILRDGLGSYLGCFYIFPDIGCVGRATAVLWLCDVTDRSDVAAALVDDLNRWLTPVLPSSITLTWETSPRLDTSE